MRGLVKIGMAAVLAGGAAWCCVLPGAGAQNDPQAQVEEVVVNQAAGRVVIAVVKGAILIGTVEEAIEPGTRPPVPVPVNGNRAGVILGAVQWTSPSLSKDLARLDLELPHIREAVLGDAPTLGGGENKEASDIEAIGKPLRDRLGEVAGSIHGKVDWPTNEPVAELVLADYIADYGPEVWQITYSMEQQQQHGDYWVTNVDDPVYLQSWPPEKGQPHTLMEFDYPAKATQAFVLDLLRQKDPRLDKLVHSDPQMADAAGKFLSGDSMKITAGEATQFLRAALGAIAPANAPQTMAIITQDRGFDWILPPPPEPKTAKPSLQNTRPADAPSLGHPHSDDSEQVPSLAHPNSR